MPKTEKRIPYRLFRTRKQAHAWLREANAPGWVIREFQHRVPDFVSIRNKKKIYKLF